VLCIAVALVLALAWILFTESGTKSAWRIATQSIEGLSTGHVEGRIGDLLKVRNLVYQTDVITLQLADAELEWQLSLPLLEELLISKLYLRGLTITLPELDDEPESKQPIDLPDRLPLPIAIAFSDIQIRDVQFSQAQQSSPFVITNVSLRGRVNANEVNFRELAVESALFTLEGFASTRVSNNYQTDSKLNWSLRASDAPEVNGSLTLDGNLKKLSYDLRAALYDESYGDITMESIGQAGLTELVVGNLTINHEQSLAVVSVDGRLVFADDVPNGEFRAHWSGLQWPLIQPPLEVATTSPLAWVRSEEGQMTLNGSIDSYSAELRAAIATPQAPGGTIVLAANGDATSLEIEKIDVRALKGIASGVVTLNWQDELSSAFDIAGEHFDPGEIFPQWRGVIDFSAHGKQRAQTIDLEQLNIEGTLRESAFILDAVASYDGKTAHFPRLAVSAGDSRLLVAGKIGDQLNLKWELQSRDLSEFYPDAMGKLNGKGTLAGKLPWPVVQAELSGSDLKVGEYSLGTAQLSASVDLLSKQSSSLTLDARSLVISGNAVESLQLTALGNRNSHTANLTINSTPADIVIDVAGAWDDDVWSGELKSGRIDPGEFASWQLSQPQKLRVSIDEQVLQEGCWLSQDAQFCIGGTRKDQTISGALKVVTLPYNYVKPWLAENVKLRGNISGSANFTGSGPELWSATAELKNSPTEIALGESEDQPGKTLLRVEPGVLSFSGDHQQMSAKLSLPIAGGGGAKGSVTLKGSGNSVGQGELVGDMTVNINDIGVLSILSKELKSLAGEIKLDLKLLGTVETPQPSGTLVLTNASVNLTTPSLSLTKIELVATVDRDGSVDYRGQVHSGEGNINIQGNRVVLGSTASSELAITGSNFEAWNSADARVTASPDLKIAVNETLVEVSGYLKIPEARITPQELPSGAISTSPDQVIVPPYSNEQDLRTPVVRDIRVHVGLSLGDKVEMEGFGFKGRMVGQLNVKQEPDKPMLASGELKVVDGEYRAYGQGLVIDTGRVLFAGGAIDNPGLSIRALRRPAQGIVVGVYAKGELRQPEISLFSEPSMSQSEQLSWLVLGRSIQNSSGAENDYITQAAMVLGIRGGNFLTRNIAENIGLDAIGIETGSGEAGSSSDVNQAALVLGKYLTPKLYISYGLGLLDSLSTVKLRYLMTERWSLVTESSVIDSGGDISYSFEK
jgi:translocation and assembly module TamB